MIDAIERFAKLARHYREWVLANKDCGPEAARRALLLIGRLYVAALDLPPRWCEDRAEVEPPPPPSWREVYPALISRLPFQHYGEVFNPLPVPPEQSLIGDLADDLADIFGDVDRGLRWFDAGHPSKQSGSGDSI